MDQKGSKRRKSIKGLKREVFSPENMYTYNKIEKGGTGRKKEQTLLDS